jgi:hypothetical protein
MRWLAGRGSGSFGEAANTNCPESIHEQAIYPVAEHTFKYPPTQEVALGSQLKERRRQVHAAVARAIEQQHPGHLGVRAALRQLQRFAAGDHGAKGCIVALFGAPIAHEDHAQRA